MPQGKPYLIFKYLGLSFQLFAVIGLGTALGWYIQQKSQMKFPVWLLLFCFLSIVAAFYHLYVSMKKDEMDERKDKKH
ncbi:Putative F0F1-ATPase subunit [Cecembia lonarensis LW9]|uniref:Putative F0F1-ATPase subunit n=1 Tax=Cecembia lonarensis (strain CCUG 58316 / KCTC 22772 / LW9) TaxID=1225176 RepID=K1LDG4_CECL9|nr:Putative F0F1-ATPase subunit [Cecembia lonarensis LW9]